MFISFLFLSIFFVAPSSIVMSAVRHRMGSQWARWPGGCSVVHNIISAIAASQTEFCFRKTRKSILLSLAPLNEKYLMFTLFACIYFPYELITTHHFIRFIQWFLFAQHIIMFFCLFFCMSHSTHIKPHKSTERLTNQTKLNSILMNLIVLKVLRNSCTVPYLFFVSEGWRGLRVLLRCCVSTKWS